MQTFGIERHGFELAFQDDLNYVVKQLNADSHVHNVSVNQREVKDNPTAMLIEVWAEREVPMGFKQTAMQWQLVETFVISQTGSMALWR